MPTTGLSLTGATCRYVYTCPSSLIESKPVNRFNKTDLISGESTEFIYGAEEVSGEPFFVAKSNESGLAGDKGWVLNLVTSHVRQQSYLYLHKADSNCLEVVACIRIPHFIPPGFHGQWISS